MTKPYLGHHCWTCWNVSLWISNEEPLYRAALDAKRRMKTVSGAARLLMEELPAKTPDGATYSFTAVRNALAGLE